MPPLLHMPHRDNFNSQAPSTEVINRSWPNSRSRRTLVFNKIHFSPHYDQQTAFFGSAYLCEEAFYPDKDNSNKIPTPSGRPIFTVLPSLVSKRLNHLSACYRKTFYYYYCYYYCYCYYYLLQLSFHSVALVLTLVQSKHIRTKYT